MMKRIGIWLFVIALIFCNSVSALAAEQIDPARKGELTVEYDVSGTALSGVSFAVYRVAEVSERGVYTLSGEFSDYSVVINGLDSEGMRSAASTLSVYAAKDQIEPELKRTTDADGRFTCRELTPGLYLLVGERHIQNDRAYVCEPTLVYLPGVDAVSGALTYAVTAAPKAEEGPLSPETVTRRVLKFWADSEDENRPRSVTVHLLRDGEIFKTVVLGEENNWRWVFSGLDGSREWSVAEEVPEGYTVTVTKEGITFLVTNTKAADPGDPDDPSDPDDPDAPDTPGDPDDPADPDDPDSPGTPGDPNDPSTPSTPDEPENPGLPQTGQLWWPVPLLAAGGMMLFILGYAMRRRGEGYEEQ